jgi:hypothetical protein
MSYAHAVEQLADAIARLVAREQPLHVDDVDAALAARDAVVVRLRALTAALLGTGPAATSQEFTVRDLATDPAHVLHVALRDLPLPRDRTDPPPIDVLHRNGTGALPQRQDATRAAAVLEPYDETLRQLPGPDAGASPLTSPTSQQPFHTSTPTSPARGPPTRRRAELHSPTTRCTP